MPRGKNGRGKVEERVEPAWGGFIDVRLTEQEKADFAQFEALFGDELLIDIMTDDVKLGVSWEATGDCFLATFTSNKHAGPALRCVLTARADTWWRAVALVTFKHLNLLEGDWGRFKPSTGRASEI